MEGGTSWFEDKIAFAKLSCRAGSHRVMSRTRRVTARQADTRADNNSLSHTVIDLDPFLIVFDGEHRLSDSCYCFLLPLVPVNQFWITTSAVASHSILHILFV